MKKKLIERKVKRKIKIPKGFFKSYNVKKASKKKVKQEVNWQRIITLSAAGRYIADQLNKELEKVPLKQIKK